jgi:TonB family protein
MKKLKFAFILNEIILLCACNTSNKALATQNSMRDIVSIKDNTPHPRAVYTKDAVPRLVICMDDTIPKPSDIFTVAEQMPEFPKGKIALLNYLRDNLRYPPIAQENGIEGKVYIRFVVDTTGALTDIHVKRSVHGGCSEEAVRLIRAMPKWIPGRNNGKLVKVAYILPVPFKLE